MTLGTIEGIGKRLLTGPLPWANRTTLAADSGRVSRPSRHPLDPSLLLATATGGGGRSRPTGRLPCALQGTLWTEPFWGFTLAQTASVPPASGAVVISSRAMETGEG